TEIPRVRLVESAKTKFLLSATPPLNQGCSPIKEVNYRKMEYQDKELSCNDSFHDENTLDDAGMPASREFTFTAQEQEFYAEKGFSEPHRCPACRAAKKARFNGHRGDGPRQMHSAVCANCGKDTEVPFEPRGDKPVYCNDCFQQQRQAA